MNEIDEEKVRNWALTFSDIISTKLKTNISFKNFKSEEVIYNEFIQKNTQGKWISLCEENDKQQPLIITIDYTSIIASTNNFFSSLTSVEEQDTSKLSFTETFIAKEVSNEIVQSFLDNNLNVNFIRNEPELSLVHPFHEDESITVYTYDWSIGNEQFGALNLCHSHVL